MTIQNYKDLINMKLYSLSFFIKHNNTKNLTDQSVLLEDFLMDIFSITKSMKIKNANQLKQNHPFIDLIDDNKKIHFY